MQIYLYGYNGFRNIGADCRMLAILPRLRRMLPHTRIVVNSFHPRNLRFIQDADVDYFHPATYPVAARRRIKESDLVILCEGNMLTDEFSKHMVIAFTMAMEQAKAAGVASMGLALDSGVLAPERENRVITALNSLALLTTRSRGAARNLKDRGVTAQTMVTADCAFSMALPSDDYRLTICRKLGLDDGNIYGVAPVDFYMFPAKIAMIGKRDDYVRWPFKATWPDNGRPRSRVLVREWTEYARFVLKQDKKARVAVIAMDPSDTLVARQVYGELKCPERSVLILGRDYNPWEMSAILGNLKIMASSRYHGVVLPLPYAVPYIAVGHDTRTLFLSQELDVQDYFIKHDAGSLDRRLRECHEVLCSQLEDVQGRIEEGVREMRIRDAENYRAIGRLAEGLGHPVVPLEERATAIA
jgi:polysaccharide pyruvyl transferase WcaK-like protein